MAQPFKITNWQHAGNMGFPSYFPRAFFQGGLVPRISQGHFPSGLSRGIFPRGVLSAWYRVSSRRLPEGGLPREVFQAFLPQAGCSRGVSPWVFPGRFPNWVSRGGFAKGPFHRREGRSVSATNRTRGRCESYYSRPRFKDTQRFFFFECRQRGEASL